MNEAQKRSARLLGLMPLIKAHSEGKTIEFRPLGQPNWKWEEAKTPVWSYQDEYRIKPEPRTVTVLVNCKGQQVRSWYSWTNYDVSDTPEFVLKRMNKDNSLNTPFSLVSFIEAK